MGTNSTPSACRKLPADARQPRDVRISPRSIRLNEQVRRDGSRPLPRVRVPPFPGEQEWYRRGIHLCLLTETGVLFCEAPLRSDINPLRGFAIYAPRSICASHAICACGARTPQPPIRVIARLTESAVAICASQICTLHRMAHWRTLRGWNLSVSMRDTFP